MSAKQSERALGCQLLPLNSSLDLSYSVQVDGIPFGGEMLTFSPECFGDSIADVPRGNDDGGIFNDRQPIAA